MLKSNKIILFIFVFLVLALNFKAGAPPPPAPPTTASSSPKCWPPPCVPIDGGISFLALAGIAYAGKKLHKKNKKNSCPQK